MSKLLTTLTTVMSSQVLSHLEGREDLAELHRHDCIKNNILEYMAEAVQTLAKSRERDDLSDKLTLHGCEMTDKICSAFEAMFLHGLRAPPDSHAKVIWDVLAECIPPHVIDELATIHKHCRVGVTRACLRDMLNTPGAPVGLQSILEGEKSVQRLVHRLYKQYAMIRDYERRTRFITKLDVLQDGFTISLRVDHPSLVGSWSPQAVQLVGRGYVCPEARPLQIPVGADKPQPRKNANTPKPNSKRKKKVKKSKLCESNQPLINNNMADSEGQQQLVMEWVHKEHMKLNMNNSPSTQSSVRPHVNPFTSNHSHVVVDHPSNLNVDSPNQSDVVLQAADQSHLLLQSSGQSHEFSETCVHAHNGSQTSTLDEFNAMETKLPMAENSSEISGEDFEDIYALSQEEDYEVTPKSTCEKACQTDTQTEIGLLEENMSDLRLEPSLSPLAKPTDYTSTEHQDNNKHCEENSSDLLIADLVKSFKLEHHISVTKTEPDMCHQNLYQKQQDLNDLNDSSPFFCGNCWDWTYVPTARGSSNLPGKQKFSFKAMASRVLRALKKKFSKKHPMESTKLCIRQEAFLEKYTAEYAMSTESRTYLSDTCAVCSVEFHRGKYRLCYMSGQRCCVHCHRNKKAVIPYRIMKNFDFKKYPVCDVAYEYLHRTQSRVWIDDFCLEFGSETKFARHTATSICLRGRVVMRVWAMGKEARSLIDVRQRRLADITPGCIKAVRLFSVNELLLVKKKKLHKLLQNTLKKIEQHLKQRHQQGLPSVHLRESI